MTEQKETLSAEQRWKRCQQISVDNCLGNCDTDAKYYHHNLTIIREYMALDARSAIIELHGLNEEEIYKLWTPKTEALAGQIKRFNTLLSGAQTTESMNMLTGMPAYILRDIGNEIQDYSDRVYEILRNRRIIAANPTNVAPL